MSGDVSHPWQALHNAAGPTLRSRSHRLRVPSSASQSRMMSAVASKPQIPGSHYKGGSLSPSVCPRSYPIRQIRQSPDINWTDQQGLRRGSGVTFRGQPNRDNFFHVPLTIPIGLPLYNPNEERIEQPASTWHSVKLFFQLHGPAQIFHLGFFDGGHRFHTLDRRPNLGIRNAEEVFLAPGPMRVPTVGFGLSVGVNFGGPDSSITFEGAEATFHITLFEPTDLRP